MPTVDERSDHEGGLIALVRETATGFGQLVADHIRLARLEMTADAKSYVREGSLLLIGGFILAVGYGMACIAAGLALSRVIGGPMAFAGLAFLHLIIGGIALGFITRRLKGVQPMQGTKEEVSRSISVLSTRSH
jgi:hypothetical protein